VSGRMTISCTEQYLFKFLPPSGPPPHACMLAAGTHPKRRVALVQIVAARCTEPDEHELGSLSLFLCLNSLLSSLNSRLQALVSPKTNKEHQNRPIPNLYKVHSLTFFNIYTSPDSAIIIVKIGHEHCCSNEFDQKCSVSVIGSILPCLGPNISKLYY